MKKKRRRKRRSWEKELGWVGDSFCDLWDLGSTCGILIGVALVSVDVCVYAPRDDRVEESMICV